MDLGVNPYYNQFAAAKLNGRQTPQPFQGQGGDARVASASPSGASVGLNGENDGQNDLSPEGQMKAQQGKRPAPAKGKGKPMGAKMPMMGDMQELSNVNSQVSSLANSLFSQLASLPSSVQDSFNNSLTSLSSTSTSLSDANDRLNRLMEMEGVMGDVPPPPPPPPPAVKSAGAKKQDDEDRLKQQANELTVSDGPGESAGAAQGNAVMATGKPNALGGAMASAASGVSKASPAQSAGATASAGNAAASFAAASFGAGRLNFRA